MSDLRAQDVVLGYEGRRVIDGLRVSVAQQRFTAVVGPNACGKSTLLRGLARLLRPAGGVVLLDGADIHRLPTRVVATRLAVLPQQPVAPDGITVGDLVGRGRHPHQQWLRQWSRDDERAVAAALSATNLVELAGRPVDELSGGQRQRVWIALVLAQETDLLLLDEPTSFLDLAHQLEVLDLLADLNCAGRTIVAVLHDLNMACRYAHEIIVMRGGAVFAQGPPEEIIDAGLVADVFGLRARVITDPTTSTPLVLPEARIRRRPDCSNVQLGDGRLER